MSSGKAAQLYATHSLSAADMWLSHSISALGLWTARVPEELGSCIFCIFINLGIIQFTRWNAFEQQKEHVKPVKARWCTHLWTLATAWGVERLHTKSRQDTHQLHPATQASNPKVSNAKHQGLQCKDHKTHEAALHFETTAPVGVYSYTNLRASQTFLQCLQSHFRNT